MRNLLTGAMVLLLSTAIHRTFAQRPDRPERPENRQETWPGSVRRDSSGGLPKLDWKDTTVGKPVVTHHELTVEGKTVSYTATAGYALLRDETGEKPLAKVFYVAYTADNAGDKHKRPVTFAFNGGPGSAAVWVHMGSFGPVRVKFADDKGDAPAPLMNMRAIPIPGWDLPIWFS
jgi:hypothetical protein